MTQCIFHGCHMLMYFFSYQNSRNTAYPYSSCFYIASFFLCVYLAGVTCGTWDLCWVMWGVSLWSVDSLVVLLRISNCRLTRYMACGILIPQPGIEASSPLLHSGLLTPGPPGKSQFCFFFCAHPTDMLYHYFTDE